MINALCGRHHLVRVATRQKLLSALSDQTHVMTVIYYNEWEVD